MKKTWELLGLILFVQGGAALVCHFTGWHRPVWLFTRLPWLDGYAVFAGIVLAVLGAAVLVGSDALAKRKGG
ncbi:hypothetical protein [Streptomyces varsoviensis]|uniref:Uncharacterized protein n=1 Tax=Streptomyces varsoviensis TaxID=67373 RepID=A0ABR5ITI4_9ACTN|nr:hypothetical protein [Streptomyces varsoviensis]KOG63942.1 hypothetical protein ADK38_42115 [Streptomyces varsoviensis]